MPIIITPKKNKKKDPLRADKTESLNKKFSRGVSDANKKAMKNVNKKAKGGDVGKILDKKSSSAIRKGGGSISEKEMIKIMLDAGKESGLFKKADGGAMNIGKGRNKKPMNMKSPKPKEMPRGRSKKPSKPRGAMPFIMPKQQEMMERMLGKGKPMEAKVGGPLKSVPEGNKGKGLSKLPTPVRNKMGFMKQGGKIMKMRGGGMAERGISFRMR